MGVYPRIARMASFRRHPTAKPPNYMAVLIGINYTSPDNEKRYSKLNGPVNDAKEMKKILIGGVSAIALPLTDSTLPLAEVFRYKKEDIFLMTDDGANRNTPRWPSLVNIVSLCFRIHSYASLCLILTLNDNNSNESRFRHCKTSFAMQRKGIR